MIIEQMTKLVVMIIEEASRSSPMLIQKLKLQSNTVTLSQFPDVIRYLLVYSEAAKNVVNFSLFSIWQRNSHLCSKGLVC